MLEQQKIVLAATLGIAAILMTTTALGLLQSSKTMTNTGNIIAVNVGVYQDSGCTQVFTTINWGNLTTGSSTTTTIYVKNTGTTQVTLSMTSGNWNPPSAGTYITETWDRENTVLNAGASTPASLVLTVSPSITGITTFSFNTTITGTQV
jgi:archaellum component FlaG (FlaF/FlaG flagellin family)